MNHFVLLNFRGVRGQLAGLVVASIIVTHIFLTAIFFFNRPNENDPHFDQARGQLTAAVELLGATSAAKRPQLLATLARVFPQMNITNLAPEIVSAVTGPDGPAVFGLRHQLGAGYRIFPVEGESGSPVIGIVLPDGAMISANLPSRPPRGPFWGGPWVITLLFVIISLTLSGLWAARALTAPLSLFAKAAEDFSLDGTDAPLPDRGPEEIRSVARALNRMRERITGLIDDRTRMLAAISHDLRTPITRLRLRSEFIEDGQQRSQMLRDLDQMQSMLESVLSFLRNGRKLEPMTLVDIATTLQLVADQFSDMGHKVVYDGLEHVAVTARPDDLHRAITNLVENGVRFGAEVTIRLETSPEIITIEVEDDGPGISDLRKEMVLEPFMRGDEARNMDEGSGFGLGLSIARAIVDTHGGALTLNDRQPHGLIVRIEMPAHAQAAGAVPHRMSA
jgi:signal transduction histidine kinase